MSEASRQAVEAAEQIIHLLSVGHVNDIKHLIQQAIDLATAELRVELGNTINQYNAAMEIAQSRANEIAQLKAELTAIQWHKRCDDFDALKADLDQLRTLAQEMAEALELYGTQYLTENESVIDFLKRQTATRVTALIHYKIYEAALNARKTESVRTNRRMYHADLSGERVV